MLWDRLSDTALRGTTMRGIDAAELWRRIIESGDVKLVFLEEKDLRRVSVIPLDDLHRIIINLINTEN